MARPKTWINCVIAIAFIAATVPLKSSVAEEEAKKEKPTPTYTNEAFLDAAFTNCVEVMGRSPEACTCEQKLLNDETVIKKQEDRLTKEDKEMAFYYYVDQARFKKETQTKRTNNPRWAANFSRKMTHLQALIIAACGA